MPDSSTNRCVTLVNRLRQPARKPPGRRHPRSLSPGDADARSRQDNRSVLMMRAPTTAGSAEAISARTGIRAVSRGGSSSVCRARGISRRRMAPRCMGNGSRPTCLYGQWGRWRKGWASVPWPGCSRSILIRCCHGWSPPPTSSKPSPSTSCTMCTSRRCNWTNSLPC